MEHRWSVRQPQQCPVVVDTVRAGTVAAKLRDIGIGGMFVETNDDGLVLNTTVNVAFSLGGENERENFRLPAIVVRHMSHGAGIMFLDIEIETLRLLRRALYTATTSALDRAPLSAFPFADKPGISLPRAANG